jgi:hypothetical protein
LTLSDVERAVAIDPISTSSSVNGVMREKEEENVRRDTNLGQNVHREGGQGPSYSSCETMSASISGWRGASECCRCRRLLPLPLPLPPQVSQAPYHRQRHLNPPPPPHCRRCPRPRPRPWVEYHLGYVEIDGVSSRPR